MAKLGPLSGRPFWRDKSLAEMTPVEWESLCDGCAKCCLEKLEDAETKAISYTAVACRLLDLGKCLCSNYAQRQRLEPGCVKLTPGNLEDLHWMPSTCAYRLLAEGRDLPGWHPLISRDTDTVHRAGQSVLGRAVRDSGRLDLEDHIVTWPE